MKSAISVATKRASIPLGDQFGLSLYNKGQTSALVGGTHVWPDPTPEEIAAREAAQAGGQSPEEPEDIQANVPQQVSLGYDEGDRPLDGGEASAAEPSLLSRIIVAISGATSLDQMTAIGNQIDAEIAAGRISKTDEQAIGAVFMPKREILLAARDIAHRAKQAAQANEPLEAGV